MCTALARALQLSDAEQAHLFRLAGHAHDTTRIPRMIPASVRRIVDRLDRHPVGVYDATWTLLSWNPLWAALFGDPSALDERARNTVWRHFTVGAVERVRQTPDEVRAFENSMVADLRATAGALPRRPRPRGAARRPAPDPRVLGAVGPAARRRASAVTEGPVVHPEVGEVAVDCDVLATQRSDLRVVVFTPQPDSDARGRLDLLAALGTQTIGHPT